MLSKQLVPLLLVVVCAAAPGVASAGQPSCGCESAASSPSCPGGDCSCEKNCRGCGRCRQGHRQYIEGVDPFFNCHCNGSYNYPVPPLYTYHWPGMFKQQRMTDYHSPWRFPPLRPYSNEPGLEPAFGAREEETRQVLFQDADVLTVHNRTAAGVTSMSSRFENLSR